MSFAYGSIKHLLLLTNGTLPAVSRAEFISRLQHILNVLDITCLGSSLSNFTSNSWAVAREYDLKVIKELQEGYKSWETMNRCIDPTIWQIARDLVSASKSNQSQNSNKTQNNSSQNNSSQKICTTWNTFKNEGCHWEFNNPGQTCVYLHHCSTCRQKGFPNRRHKAIHCNSNSQTQAAPSVTSNAVPSSAPVVTSV